MAECARVIDCGSQWLQAGFAGEQHPWHFALSAVADGPLTEENGNLPHPTLRHPLNFNVARNWQVRPCWRVPGPPPGTPTELLLLEAELEASFDPQLVFDADAYTAAVDRIFDSRRGSLRAGLAGELVLITEFNDPQARATECLAELFFEQFRAEGFYAAPRACLACFAAGRQTGLAVDIGASGVSLAPVIDGYLLRKSLRRSPVGGNVLDAALLRRLDRQHVSPQWQWRWSVAHALGVWSKESVHETQTEASDSWRTCSVRDVVRRLREDFCFVAPDGAAAASADRVVELPDGTSLDAATIADVPECLLDYSRLGEEIASKYGKSLPAAVASLICQCDVECRKDFLSNLILLGGGVSTPGLAARMTRSLQESEELGHSASKVKVIAPQSPRFVSWLGGSILASLGSFRELWIGSAEWEEHGTQIVSRKCNL